MSDKVRDAAQALVDKLPRPDSLAYPQYFALDELDALRAALASPPQEQAPGWMQAKGRV